MLDAAAVVLSNSLGVPWTKISYNVIRYLGNPSLTLSPIILVEQKQTAALIPIIYVVAPRRRALATLQVSYGTMNRIESKFLRVW